MTSPGRLHFEKSPSKSSDQKTPSITRLTMIWRSYCTCPSVLSSENASQWQQDLPEMFVFELFWTENDCSALVQNSALSLISVTIRISKTAMWQTQPQEKKCAAAVWLWRVLRATTLFASIAVRPWDLRHRRCLGTFHFDPIPLLWNP